MNKNFADNTFLFASNSIYIEEIYQKFLEYPSSVSQDWQEFFHSNPAHYPAASWMSSSSKIVMKKSHEFTENKAEQVAKNDEFASLESIRTLGHFAAKIDPLGLTEPKTTQELCLDPNHPKLKIYTSNLGVEFSHIPNDLERDYLYSRYEEIFCEDFTNQQKLSFLKDLCEVEGFEQFLHKKFPGAKRFSVEGADSSIVSMKKAIEESSNFGVSEVVIGMAHRGRLNTLVKILKKPYESVIAEFMGVPSIPESLGMSGDVKYHMGYSNDIISYSNAKIHLSLTPNPSHLEAVNPVVAGRVRAKQDLLNDSNREKVMALLVHGDAAFCGQGVVAESLALSPLEAFDIGGIFHIIINNQVGFTANPDNGHKNSRYSTEIAKSIFAPIIHVNGDDIESVIKATKLLSEYRAKFKKDVVLEIVCYRKYGHNEGDEPMYTQPVMYNIIKNCKTPSQKYAAQLIASSLISDDDYSRIKNEFNQVLEQAYARAKSYESAVPVFDGVWAKYSREESLQDQKLLTGVSKSKLLSMLEKLVQVPKGFNLNNKLKKLFDERIKNATEADIIDWATAETLAFASLLDEGVNVRLVGQDAGRGTFSHRHSVLHDQENGSKYIPLNSIRSDQAKYEVYDSNLSEFGVLGFEYGYSLSSPNSLVIWEAQFGDFCNGAQIIFDQFLSSAETKWLKLSGLTLLLPHSYEGQGPEHSSTRFERILQLCANNNMQVVYPTTPASIFHVLRRQILRKIRKPLIIMSPKSIFRNNLAISKLDEISENTKFLPVIPDVESFAQAKKLILCSGKIYYDLLEHRSQKNIKDTAVVRIEQLYPFPIELVNEQIHKYNGAAIVWCQEEPENMGALHYIHSRISKDLTAKDIKYISRPEASSPATGYAKVHQREQEEIIIKAFS
ncbi:MAG: 2-oxoglutarate dehydrogenase E1 component [Rickettsiaceae bacterium]|nr:2-oxoglutarate dehydrogenase E1 component [Rickettsiaceae bacterium]